jgi:hypothetical protein
MSRAYRIRVQESLRRVITAGDHVSTQLELLEILPAAQMAELLAQELERGSFQRKGKLLVRQEKGVVLEVDPQNANVAVRVEAKTEVEVTGERHAVGDREADKQTNKKAVDAAREELRKDLEKKVDNKKAELASEATKKLQGTLADVRKELDQVVNRVTAEALKKKAAQMGRIKELSEDRESGSLKIVVEV